MEELSKEQSKISGYILMVLSGFLLALVYEATSELDRDLDWQCAVLSRGLIGTIIGVPIAWRYLKQITCFNKILAIRNVLTTAYLFVIYFAVSKILPADAIAITSTQPIWIAVISIFCFGYRYFFRFWVAGVVAAVGVGILVSAKPPDDVFVVGLVFLATIARGVTVILLRYLKDVQPSIIALHFSLIVLVASSIVFFFSGGHQKLDTILDVKGITLLLIIGVGATFFQILQAKVAIIHGSITTAVIVIVAVIFSYVMDIFLRHGPVDSMHTLGIFMVVFPTFWIVFSKHVQKPIE